MAVSGNWESTTTVSTPEGPVETAIFVEYEFDEPSRGSWDEPPSGGEFTTLKILDELGNEVILSDQEIDRLEQEIVDSYGGDFASSYEDDLRMSRYKDDDSD